MTMEQQGILTRLTRRQEGFTIVESMAAAVILVIAVVLTITPLALSMRVIDRSKEITVAENLAQARVEEIRSLDYTDVGNPGYAPDGILERVVVEEIEGKTYTITTDIEYVGAATGLAVIPQGGDGVEGDFDPGVNYKYVSVTVASDTGTMSPIRMDSIIAPPTLGALEDVAVVTVEIDEHEPYDEYLDQPPILQLQGPNNYLSSSTGSQQPFPDVTPGNYEIVLFTANNWQFHPETVATGANFVTATGGWNSTRTVRVYQPATLTLTVEDTSGGSIATAVVTIEGQGEGAIVTNPEGDYVFSDLVPDRFTVTANASGYIGNQIEVDVPGPGGGNTAIGTIVLTSLASTTTTTTTTTTTVPSSSTTTTTTTIPTSSTTTTTTTVPSTPGTVQATFHIGYWDFASFIDYYIHGAVVNVTHSVLGSWAGTTNAAGDVTFTLPDNETGFDVTAETEHGHQPVSQSFDTGTADFTMSIALGKPSSTDRFAVDGPNPGPDDYFKYQIETFRRGRWRWSQQSTLPANDLGNATFLVGENAARRVRIKMFCSDGTRIETIRITLDGENHTWYPTAVCP